MSLRINVHDFSGHPFQVELSRELARRGHQVLHTYADEYVTGRGRMQVAEDDPDTLQIVAIRTGRSFDKYSVSRRLNYEQAHASAWLRALARTPVDLVVACNVPLLAHARVVRRLRRDGLPWVFWHQDVYSVAMVDELRRRSPGVARLVGPALLGMERRLVRGADAVVGISDAFLGQYHEWGVDTRHVSILPNWAPLNDIRPAARDNAWSRAHGLPDDDVLRLLYTGTLGRKHNPALLLQLLDELAMRGVRASLTVCSEGDGANLLAGLAKDRSDVRILGFQPADQYSDVLGSADVAVAILENEASLFSVPSKVTSYLSAGRVTVGLMPESNAAAHEITRAGGFAAAPNQDGVHRAAAWIAAISVDSQARLALQNRARTYARRHFDISSIGNHFEQIFLAAADRRPTSQLLATDSAPAA